MHRKPCLSVGLDDIARVRDAVRPDVLRTDLAMRA